MYSNPNFEYTKPAQQLLEMIEKSIYCNLRRAFHCLSCQKRKKENSQAQKRENVGLSNFTDDVMGMHSCRDGVYIDWKFFSDICFFGVCLVRGCVADSSMRSCNKILDAKSG